MSLNDWSAEDVAQRLSGSGRSAAKRQGDGFMVCCPAHNDRTPSLSLADGSSGLLLYNCFAGCSADDVRRALEDKLGIDPNAPAGDQKDRERSPKKQIKPADEIEVIVPAPEGALRGTLDDFYHSKLGLPSKVWTYRLPDGSPASWVARYEIEDGSKEIIPWSWARNKTTGEQKLRMKSIPDNRPLYNLDQIAERPDDPILWVEGEKAADACKKLFPGWITTTTSGGGNAVKLHDLSPLYGRIVILLCDHDGPGYSTGAELADLLLGRCDLRQVIFPNQWPDGTPYIVNQKDDGADHVERGWTADKLREMVKQDYELVMPLREIAAPFNLIHYDKVAERKFARQ